MASRFAALADSDEDDDHECANDHVQATEPVLAKTSTDQCASVQGEGSIPEPVDDEGFLDAFFHNNKAARHIATRVARETAQRRRKATETSAFAVLVDSASDSDEDGSDDDETDVAQTTSRLQDLEIEPLRRISKKAAARALRREEKEQKKQSAQEGTKPDDSPSIKRVGEEAEEEERPQKKKNNRQKKSKHVIEEGTNIQHVPKGQKAADEDGDGNKSPKSKPKKTDIRKQREIEQQRLEAERRAEEETDDDKFTDEAGGILDAKYRRRILNCPTEIAPVPGLKHVWEIAIGFVSGMRGPARFFADDKLALLCLQEVRHAGGGFLPAVRQLANVATLPGLMGCSLGMPDIHSGYGFAVGSVAAIDLTDPEAVVSPGGVGFDINCGVRLLRTELTEKDIKGSLRSKLATAIFEAVPAGVGANGVYTPSGDKELKTILRDGMNWALKKGYCWEDDLRRTEEGGSMPDADPDAVSVRAIKRGSPQMGTLGSGNHYLEIQVVDEVFDTKAADAMGLSAGKVCVMIHCGSRGLGHQLCTDYLQNMTATMQKQGITVPDRQLCCVRAASPEGDKYLRGMAAAANYAFVNRTLIAHSVRETFGRVLGRDPKDDLGMHMVYDVSHNIAKKEFHIDPADGKTKPTLVHRKGATRSFPPGHPALPEEYREVGQPVLIGGSMGTCSFVLAGNEQSMELSFGSTCHGAGRRMSRSESLRSISAPAVLAKLRQQGIEVRVTSPKLVAEEADESYKDVMSVVQTCHEVGVSRIVARLRPLAVIKG